MNHVENIAIPRGAYNAPFIPETQNPNNELTADKAKTMCSLRIKYQNIDLKLTDNS